MIVQEFWVIHFEDADRSPEMFTEESIAREVYKQAGIAWNCALFGPAAVIDDLRAKLQRKTEALEGARGAIVSLGATFYSIANGVYGAEEIMQISPNHDSFCDRRCRDANIAVSAIDAALKERDAEAQL